MRNSDIKKLFKAEADSIMPDFDAMLERINAEPIERERVVNPETPQKKRASIARRSAGAARSPWRCRGNERTAAKPRYAVGAASFCFALMMIVSSVFAVGYFSKAEIPNITIVGADTYVSVNINPGVDFTVNKYNKITSAVATNSGGVLLITKLCDTLGVETLVGRELNDALVDVIETAAKMGYIDVEAVGISNAMMISVIAENDDKSGAIKNDLAEESKKYFADNGIYAVVVTEYDNKKSLVEEARKNNPELSEDASVGDLISSIEKNNADKSALQAEIEEARRNYETYLRRSFNESKDKAVNKEISAVNGDIARLERLIASLNDMLAEKSAELEADDTRSGTAYGTDEVIAAIKSEIETKTAAYNKRLLELDEAQAQAEREIARAEAEIAAIGDKLALKQADIEARLAQKDEYTAANAADKARLAALNAELDDVNKSISGISRVINFLNGEKKWLEVFSDTSVYDDRYRTLVETIVNEAVFYEVMLDGTLSDADRVAELERAARLTCYELFGSVTGGDNVMIKTIIGEFSKQGLGVYRASFVGGTEAIMNALGLSTTKEINLVNALMAKETLTDNELNIRRQIGELESELAKLEKAIADIENIILLLNKDVAGLNDARTTEEGIIASEEAELVAIAEERAKEIAAYRGVLTAAVKKAEAQINKLALTRNSLRVFRDEFKEGNRLPGYDVMNAELRALEDKLRADIEKNDADALAKNLEAEIKSQADELFNENVNKFNEHNRQFTADEYAAWEAEQKEIVKDLSWDEIYSSWLESQA